MQLFSSLAGWSPALIELPCVPEVAIPFLEIFRDDELLLFEMCAAFFLNWGESWLTGPWIGEGMLDMPRKTLEHTWMVLGAVDQELLLHLDACAKRGVSPDAESHHADAKCTILWPMLKTVLWRCLIPEAWLALWDHLILLWREPQLLGIAAIAVLRCIRGVLLALPACSADRLCGILEQPQVIPIPRLLEEFYSLRKRASALALSLSKPADIELLPAGKPYPSFPCEANVVLDFLVQDRARARAEFEVAGCDLNAAEDKYAAIQALVLEETKHAMSGPRSFVMRMCDAKWLPRRTKSCRLRYSNALKRCWPLAWSGSTLSGPVPRPPRRSSSRCMMLSKCEWLISCFCSVNV